MLIKLKNSAELAYTDTLHDSSQEEYRIKSINLKHYLMLGQANRTAKTHAFCCSGNIMN